jgi:hypothetical protein
VLDWGEKRDCMPEFKVSSILARLHRMLEGQPHMANHPGSVTRLWQQAAEYSAKYLFWPIPKTSRWNDWRNNKYVKTRYQDYTFFPWYRY